jgi:hypothetical protein
LTSEPHLQQPVQRSRHRSLLHQAARWYAKRGKPVFPCKPHGKDPLTPHGFKDATTDLAQIDLWWTRWPDANIGMPTGQASGVIVFDIDPRHGGLESYEVLINRHGAFPDTAEGITGRGDGGRHIFVVDPGVKLPEQLADGIDIQADGAYVIMAPSIHPDSGKPYTWDGLAGKEALLNPAACPEWILELAKPKDGPKATAKHKVPWDIGGVIKDGAKHDTIVSLAGTLRVRGLPLEAAFGACRGLHFESLVSDEDILKRVENVYRNYSDGPHEIRVTVDRITPSVELLNAEPVFRGRIEFDRIRRRGSLIEATFTNGAKAIWYTATDLTTFNRSQAILFAATGCLIRTPPDRKIKLTWEPIAELIRRISDQDCVDMEPETKDEFSQVLRSVWQRAKQSTADDDDEFFGILQACNSYRRDPNAEPPSCAIWIAAGYCWIHQPTLIDWLSTPGGKHHHYKWDEVRTALLLLNFVQQDIHRSQKGNTVHVRLWKGPLDVLTDDETELQDE